MNWPYCIHRFVHDCGFRAFCLMVVTQSNKQSTKHRESAQLQLQSLQIIVLGTELKISIRLFIRNSQQLVLILHIINDSPPLKICKKFSPTKLNFVWPNTERGRKFLYLIVIVLQYHCRYKQLATNIPTKNIAMIYVKQLVTGHYFELSRKCK